MEFNLLSAILRAKTPEALEIVDSVKLEWLADAQVSAAIASMAESRTNDLAALTASLRSHPTFGGQSVVEWTDRITDEHFGAVSSVGVYLKSIRAAHASRMRSEIARRIIRDSEDPEACAAHTRALEGLVSDEVVSTQIAEGYLDVLDERLRTPNGEVIPSHCHYLDRTAPFRKSHISVIAAGTGGGKTTFALNVAQAAAEAGHGVLIISMEMRRHELCDRIVSSVSGVEAEKLLKFECASDEERAQVRQVASEVEQAPIDVVDAFAVTESAVAAQCRKAMRKRPFSLLIVDYIQLMKSDRRTSTRSEEVSACTRAMKLLANELDIAVILISQFNRSRDHDEVPLLSHLKESGSIEQDASTVLLMHEDKDGLTQVCVAKNRAGAAGKSHPFRFNKATFTFKYAAASDRYDEFNDFS